MLEFSEKFSKMVNYGFMGVYRRLSVPEEDVDTRFVPAIAKACGIAAYLNFKFDLWNGNQRILPETERELFKMFEFPLVELINLLPEKYAAEIKEETFYCGIGALFESTELNKGILTEDGYIMLGNRAIFESKDSFDQIGEYDGQRIFEELCKGEYIDNRLFLEKSDNVYIPENRIHQSEEQYTFMKAFPDLFKMCYRKNTRLSLYKCKRCGMVLREPKLNVFSCISKKCNHVLDKKIEIDMHGSGWVMNDIVARNIYYPGQLEQDIKMILDKALENKIIEQYEMWPGKYSGIFDTWDFKVKLKDGRILLIDAKDVENPHWIITDKREFLADSEFIYVVPNDKHKFYVEQINNNISFEERAYCIRVKELEKILGVK